MSEQDLRPAGTAAGAAAPTVTAGAMLREARAAAGLGIDAAAQQLKLAPRQVRALEEGDFASLPGRTFVRGFVRNYARLLHLDADTVLAALPAAAAGPALEAPTLHPTAPSIGELPTTEPHRPGWTRWAIPLTLAAIVAAAAVYEFLRPQTESHRGAPPVTTYAPPVAGGVPDAPPATSLPNPIAAVPSQAPAEPESTPAAAATPRPAGAAGSPAAPPDTTTPTAVAPTMPPAAKPAAPAGPRTGTPTTGTQGAASEPAIADATMALTFRDYSWVEIKDRNGRVLLSRMNAGGTSETVSGPPPLDVVIGNANDVKVTYRGKPVDLAPYTRQNVAKVVLP